VTTDSLKRHRAWPERYGVTAALTTVLCSNDRLL